MLPKVNSNFLKWKLKYAEHPFFKEFIILTKKVCKHLRDLLFLRKR